MRVAVVGAGGIGRTYLQVLAASPEADLVGVADADAETRAWVGRAYGVNTVASHEQLEGIDAAIVSTPPSTHREITTHLLGRNVAVLCEKPLAITVADAIAMAEAAARSGAPLTMASKFRYVPDVVTAKSLIESDILGEVILYENTFASKVDMSARWN